MLSHRCFILFLCSTPPAPAEMSDAALLRAAIVELAAEGAQAMEDGRLPRQETTFAREFLERSSRASINGDLVFDRLQHPAHKDPFVDAHIRWQLFGFEPIWPETERDFDDEEFEEMLSDLPALLPNPRSDRGAIGRINAALAREQVSDSDAEAIRALDQSLRDESARISDLNRPGLELRGLIEERVGEVGHRAHQVRLEHLAAMVEAGWPVEDLKRRIADHFEQARDDAAFTAEQRERVASQAVKLIGLRTPLILSVGIGENNSPQAQFDETAVYDFEVNEWIRILQGK